MRIVVLACGNPSRGDDALGPAFATGAAAIARRFRHVVETQIAFQLAPEHALDLVARDAALFVDASVDAPPPFRFLRVHESRDRTFTSHAMSPAAVLAAHAAALGAPPPAFALAIRGQSFHLGAPMTRAAFRHLDTALAFYEALLGRASPQEWDCLATPPTTRLNDTSATLPAPDGTREGGVACRARRSSPLPAGSSRPIGSSAAKASG